MPLISNSLNKYTIGQKINEKYISSLEILPCFDYNLQVSYSVTIQKVLPIKIGALIAEAR